MHQVLASQMERCRRPDGQIDYQKLYKLIEKSYSEFDKDRSRFARISRLMSTEIEALTRQQELTLASLHLEHQKLDDALEHSANGLAMFDGSGQFVLCNRLYRQMIGLSPEETIRNYDHCVELWWARMPSEEENLKDIPQHMAKGTPVERILALKDGSIVSIAYRPRQKGGWIELHRDITEQQRAYEKIRYLTRHDYLTGAANRSVFNETIKTMLARRAKANANVAVIYLDLDHFKNINDTLNYSVGDRLLQEVSSRLQAAAEPEHLICRLGGDEFSILQFGGEQPEIARRVATRIVESLSKPFIIGNHSITTAASIGVAVAPADGDSCETLMRNAEIALYFAKANGRGFIRFFEAGMDEGMRQRRALEADLRIALDQNQFELFYQPLVALRPTLRLTGFEALIRWHHPTRGLVAPGEFIPIAEEMGLILELGKWTLMEATRQAMLWPEHISVAVNVSVAQFSSPNFVANVESALKISGLTSDRLQLEITESILITNTDHAVEILHALSSLGVRIAMDDFGTGYSSLNYLRRFPFNKLKIDRAFISDLTLNLEADAIVQAIIELAHTLGMETTAEGVETTTQQELLLTLNCNEIQGYLISRPLPADQIGGILTRFKNPTDIAA